MSKICDARHTANHAGLGKHEGFHLEIFIFRWHHALFVSSTTTRLIAHNCMSWILSETVLWKYFLLLMFSHFSLWDFQTKISFKITVKIKSNNTEIRASDIIQVSNRQCIIIFVHSMTVAPPLISYQRNYHISLKTYI